jgi:hypothetical protein
MKLIGGPPLAGVYSNGSTLTKEHLCPKNEKI